MEFLFILLAAAAILWFVVRKRKPPRQRDAHLPEKARRAIEKRRTLETLPSQFIVADIETTGLEPETDEIIEIAAIRVHRDADEHQTFTALVKPGRKLPAKIVKLTGITDEVLAADGMQIDEALSQFLDFVGGDMMVFYNAPFDIAFLDKAAAQIGRKIPNKICCALRVARSAWPDQGSYKLTDLASAGNINTDDAHRALADCKAAMIVYAAGVKASGRIGYVRGR